MAIYKPPVGVSTFDSTFDLTFTGQGDRVRGSQGGSTFQKIGTSFAIRHRAGLCNKRTSRQTHSRNRFHGVQSFYRTLDESEQLSFVDETANYERVDSLGQVYTMSGINLQNSVNTNANTNNQAPVTSMPAPQPPPAIAFDFANINLTIGAMDVITFPQVLPSTHSMLVFATRPVNAGQLANENLFVFLGVVPPSADTADYNWLPVYEATFGVNQNNVGQIFGVSLQFVSQVTFMTGLTITATSEQIEP